jgi:hypothetical protein
MNEHKPEFKYVRIDETKHWNEKLLAELGPGTKIIATYVFNAAEVTYCCELTPSHYLRYLGTEIKPGRELTDEEWEHYDEVVRDAEYESENEHYRHCNSIKDSHPVPCDAETLDDVIEEYQANPW